MPACRPTLFLLILCIFVFNLAADVRAQDNQKVLDYLWHRDFRQLVSEYAEEQIQLYEKGSIREKYEMRSHDLHPGFRVQVFAGMDSTNADALRQKMQALELDSVYLTHEGKIFRVQLGNFIQRLEAEKMLDRLRFAGETNAWIVPTTIHVPRQPAAEKEAPGGEVSISFAIQLFVTADEAKARQLQTDFENRLKMPVFLKKHDTLWKLLAGPFLQENRARQNLEKVKELGFDDAWLTQTTK